MFPQNLTNDLIRTKLKKLLQGIIKNDDLNYKSKREKTYNFGKYFLRDIHEGYLSIKTLNQHQNQQQNQK